MRPLLGIALKLLATLAFTTMSACIKELSNELYPTGQTVFCRSIFALLPLMLWLAWRGEIAGFYRAKRFSRHLTRSISGCASMFCFFAALAFLPLPDATAIGYTTPLITVVLAALVLDEKVGFLRWSAVAVGLVGVAVMLSPYLAGGALAQGLSGSELGIALALANCVLAAAAMIQVRQMITSGESTGAIVFYFQLLSSLIALATVLLGDWKAPDLKGSVLLVSIGVLGGIGQILLVVSYRHADASTLAPFDYTSMIWALVIGWLLFDERPFLAVIIGAAIVIASGMFVIWRERKLGAARAARAPARPPSGSPSS